MTGHAPPHFHTLQTRQGTAIRMEEHVLGVQDQKANVHGLYRFHYQLL
jgi:hypothetical protein